ncbi:sodium:proton antiporter [Clostridia bacterium]|nr:sodium:proton antiporter [Clostridia bacterium]
MEVTTVVIAILFAIVLSNVVNNLFPHLPLTLIQIAFGAILALLFVHNPLEMEPEIFMVLIIAPLLFREAEEANLMALWKVMKPVFLMAFVLVFITVFAIGFAVSWLVPTIPMAACFVLGAILGPTDIVAVTSLSRRVKIGSKLMDTLRGEGLINDASGLVSFHFAVTALLTGMFSPINAAGQLVVVALGGTLIGVALAMAKRWISVLLRRLSAKNTTTHVLIEVLMPFLCYVVAEAFHTSGVLAVVAAGTVQAMEVKKVGLFEAEFNSEKRNLWEVLTFTLNSLVFILLGLQLPEIIHRTWIDPTYSPHFLIFVTVLVLVLVFGVRFISLMLMARSVTGSGFTRRFKDTLLLTLSGVKGAVSLAIAFSMPFVLVNDAVFAERPLLMFITAGVIILSLVIALFTLPLVVDGKPRDNAMEEAEKAVLREVVVQLHKQQEHDPDISESLISGYHKRLHRLEEVREEDEKNMKMLRVIVFETEHEIVKGFYESENIDEQTYNDYMDFMSTIYHLSAEGATRRNAVRLMKLMRMGRTKRRLERSSVEERLEARKHIRNLQELFRRNTAHVVEALNNSRGKYPDGLIDWQIEERRNMSRQLMESVYNDRFQDRMHKDHEHEQLKGYYVERRVIHQLLERHEITKDQANELRVKVNKLESFTLGEGENEIMDKLLSLTARRRKELSAKDTQ